MGQRNNNGCVDNLRPWLTNLTTWPDQLKKVSPYGPAGRLQTHRDLEGRASGIPLERQNELDQSRHKVVVCFNGWQRFGIVSNHSSRF